MQPTARKPPDAFGIRGFTLAAEKYVFPGKAGENMYWNLFRRLRAPEVCDAFLGEGVAFVIFDKMDCFFCRFLVS